MTETAEMHMKITLDTGRTVLFRPLQIKYYKVAAQAAAKQAGNNQTLLSMHLQDELAKMLMVELNGKKLSMAEKESFESMFSPTEYRQIMMTLEELIGDVERPKVEMVSYSGDKSPGSVATQA